MPFVLVHRLETRPPLGQGRIGLTGFGAQQQKIVGGAKAFVLDQPEGLLAGATLEAALHVPDLAHRHAEALGNGDMAQLLAQHMLGGAEHGVMTVHAAHDVFAHLLPHRFPQHGGEKKRRGHRLVLVHARIGVRQRTRHQRHRKPALLVLQAFLRQREQVLEQAVVAQQFVGFERITAVEQLQHLLEHARRRHRGHQGREFADGRGGFVFEFEAQLGGEPDRAQHAHRVFAKTCLGITDDAQDAGLEIGHSADIINDAEIADVVVQRVDGEIAPHGIFFLGAEHVVIRCFRLRLRRGVFFRFAVLHLFHRKRLLGDVTGDGAEGRDLDDLPPEAHVHQAEAPADHARVMEQLADLLGPRVGYDVEILWLAPQHEVAHAPAHQQAGVAGLFQAVQDLEGVFADLRARDNVLRARNDDWNVNLYFTWVISKTRDGMPYYSVGAFPDGTYNTTALAPRAPTPHAPIV